MLKVENEKQEGILREFQNRVSDLCQDEWTCLRFLKAREFDINKAEEMIRNNQTWKREVLDVGIEAIRNLKPTEDVISSFPMRLTGKSRNGGPVMWYNLGDWKFREWIDSGRKTDLQMYDLHMAEKLIDEAKAMGNKQVTLVYDLENLSFRTVSHMGSLGFAYSATQTSEQNYPELLDTLIVINAPWICTIVFDFVKPILSAHTISKIKILGADKNAWLPVLREKCEEGAIPKEYLES